MAARGTGVARAHPLGDSSKVTVGEEVVAIRNPLGLDFSLSSGVVSATNRELQSSNGATIQVMEQIKAGTLPQQAQTAARLLLACCRTGIITCQLGVRFSPPQPSRVRAHVHLHGGERARRAASVIALATPMAEARHEEQESSSDRTL